jgi:hypothetical protein
MLLSVFSSALLLLFSLPSLISVNKLSLALYYTNEKANFAYSFFTSVGGIKAKTKMN